MSSHRIVISTTTSRSRTPVLVLPDQYGRGGATHWLVGRSTVARGFQAMIGLGLLGAFCHSALGVGVALVLALLVAPLLSGGLALAWTSRGEQAENALQTSLLVCLATPLLLFPGALLGWMGAPLWALATGLVRLALNR